MRHVRSMTMTGKLGQGKRKEEICFTFGQKEGRESIFVFDNRNVEKEL